MQPCRSEAIYDVVRCVPYEYDKKPRRPTPEAAAIAAKSGALLPKCKQMAQLSIRPFFFYVCILTAASMATLAVSTMSASTGSASTADLHHVAERYDGPMVTLSVLTECSLIRAQNADPFNILRMRDDFQGKALKDATINSGDTAMLSDPYNPLLVKSEMEAQKASRAVGRGVRSADSARTTFAV